MLTEDLGWQQRGSCRTDPQMWDSASTAGRAIHECLRQCPVLALCWRWADSRGDWDSVTVAGQRWTAAVGSRPCQPLAVQPAEEPCPACLAAGGCVECGGPMTGRSRQAKTCSPACARVRKNRNHRRYEHAQRASRRRCVVCRTGLPASSPARSRTCPKESCVDGWRARLSRGRNRALTARRKAEEVLAA